MDEQELMSGISPDVDAGTKMVPQHEVNAIIAGVKKSAAEKARQEVEREYQQKMEQQRQSYAPNGNEQQAGGFSPPSQAQADALYQQVQERMNSEMEGKMREFVDQEIQSRQIQHQATNLANMYEANIEQSRKDYSDFDEVSKGFDPRSFPNLVYLVANMPNSGDILYELLKNPEKLNAIDDLSQKAPQLAHARLAQLSQSIAKNKAAVEEGNQYKIAEPLSPLTPSRVSGSNGKMTVSDLRSQHWLKG
jgi:hypothetical protein